MQVKNLKILPYEMLLNEIAITPLQNLNFSSWINNLQKQDFVL